MLCTDMLLNTLNLVAIFPVDIISGQKLSCEVEPHPKEKRLSPLPHSPPCPDPQALARFRRTKREIASQRIWTVLPARGEAASCVFS